MVTLLGLGLALPAAGQALDRADASADDALIGVGAGYDPGAVDGAPIINGEAATIDDWPMTGGLIVNASATIPQFGTLTSRALMCSATLIAPDVVLLAAHCVDIDGLIDAASQGGVAIEDLQDLQFGFSRQVELWQYDLVSSALNGPLDWPEDTVFAKDWVYHEDFSLAGLQVGLAENFDVALLFLEEPILDVPFALLPTAAEADQVVVGAPVTIVGWGQQQQDAIAGTVGYKRMAASTIDEVADYEMQIGKDYENGRKCHGDSGGPTFLDVTTTSAITTRTVGITSHAYDATTDCRVTGGVDTRVDHYLGWIDQQMSDRCADGTRVWCEVDGIVPPPDANGDFVWEQVATGDPLDGDGEDGKGGCGCAVGPSGAPGGAVLALTAMALAVLGVRRRV